MPNGDSGKWFRINTDVSLGSLIHIAVLLIGGVVFVVMMNDRTASVAQEHAKQDVLIQAIVARQQTEAELEARTAAVLEGLERRVSRIEDEADHRK
jgi:sensor domain CHASE-containing protein